MADKKRLVRRRTVRLTEDVDDFLRMKEQKGQFDFNRWVRKNAEDVVKKELKKSGRFRVG